MSSVVSSKKAQTLIGCGKTKFWELVACGEFPNAYKVGRKIMVPKSDIEEFVFRSKIRK